jgi:hypothetical protein
LTFFKTIGWTIFWNFGVRTLALFAYKTKMELIYLLKTAGHVYQNKVSE